jgi:DNA-binding Lrp family transcriptional regulator
MDQTVRNGYNETVRQVHAFVLSLVSLVPDLIEKLNTRYEGDSDREQLLNSLAAASYPTYAAAAQALGISVETAKKRIHRLSWGKPRLQLLSALEREGPELAARLAGVLGDDVPSGLLYFVRPESQPTQAPSVTPEPAAVVAENANEVQESINPAPGRASKAEDQLLEQWGRVLTIARMLLDQEFADRVIAAYIHEPDVERDFLLSRSIGLFSFTFRSYNCLRKENIKTLGQLVEQTKEDLLEIRNFGKMSLQDVIDVLAELDLALKQSPPLTS